MTSYLHAQAVRAIGCTELLNLPEEHMLDLCRLASAALSTCQTCSPVHVLSLQAVAAKGWSGSECDASHTLQS